MRTTWASIALFLALGLLAGCGKSKPTQPITGKLILPQKMKLTETDAVDLTFQPEDIQATGGTATVNIKDMTFSTAAAVGKYRVVIEVKPYPGQKDSEKRAREFESFNGAHNGRSSPIYYEVTEGAQTITIDAASDKVTKP